MPVPTWSVGQVLAAADVNSWFVPLVVVKPSDESVTSSTVLQNDNDLILPFAANSTYAWQCRLKYVGGTRTAADLKWQWAPPAGSSTDYTNVMMTTGGGVASVDDRSGLDVVNAATNGAGNFVSLLLFGTTVTVGAGSMQLTWAQNTSNATATTIKQYSSFIAWKVG